MRRLGVSRRQLFETVERAALASLPAQEYEFADWRFARVSMDYHVEFKTFFYSVPHALIRQQVDIRATARMIESFHRGKRIAVHQRRYGGPRYGHLRKSRAAKDGEFLRPYKRILPDVISSDAALLRALSIANDLYVALDRQGYRVHIAPAGEGHRRIPVQEQEVERKDRKYGRYNSGSIWGPDRPTIFYIDTVPIGLAITEMTERVTMRYINGDYHREDSRLVRSMKAWQLTHSWTTEQDMPSGRFRIIAYSPKTGVDWSLSWQDTEAEPLAKAIPRIVETLRASRDRLQSLMAAEDEAEARRKKEREEEWERYLQREDERKVAQAIKESRQQLAEIIESWGKAIIVERFFSDVEQRMEGVDEALRQHLEGRLKLARQMMGSIDPLDFMANWRAPDDRYRSRYDPSPQPPSGGPTKEQ